MGLTKEAKRLAKLAGFGADIKPKPAKTPHGDSSPVRVVNIRSSSPTTKVNIAKRLRSIKQRFEEGAEKRRKEKMGKIMLEEERERKKLKRDQAKLAKKRELRETKKALEEVQTERKKVKKELRTYGLTGFLGRVLSPSESKKPKRRSRRKSKPRKALRWIFGV